MRIAFVDLVFSWPPNGGADVDLFHVAQGLQQAGHDTHLFVVHEQDSYERGRVTPELLPFPATRLDVTTRELAPAKLCARLRSAVDPWRPDVVFIQHGYALKPYVADALRHHRIIGRFYAHEMECARDAFRFKNGRPCPCNYLRTPDVCRNCAASSQKAAINTGRFRTWTADYLAARAYDPEFHTLSMRALHSYHAVIVSNSALRDGLLEFHPDVRVVPGGISLEEFDRVVNKNQGQTTIAHPKLVLMSGRAEDPGKGLSLLLEAAKRLRTERQDFTVAATHFDHTLSNEWFRAVGWLDRNEMLMLYAQSAVVVVPSIWEEPFGLVAVEGMAARKPVVASRVGGLAEIVRHGKTGFLFASMDAATLAVHLARLLDDPSLREQFGNEGRRVVETEYEWRVIIERHYLPLLEHIIRE